MSTVKTGPQRRTVAPTQQLKVQITLEEWEARAPLSDLALRSVATVQAASEKVPLPLKVSPETRITTGSFSGNKV